MTKQEIIEREQASGLLCMAVRGMFFTAYNGSAQAVSRITGYKIKRTLYSTAALPCCYTGFPVSSIEKVIALLEQNGGKVVSRETNYLEIAGIDTTFDRTLLDTYPVTAAKKNGSAAISLASPSAADPATALLEKVRSFNISAHTPLEAMNFLQTLQTEYCTR